MDKRAVGYTLGVASAMCYGLNPLFAIPLYNDGMDVDSVLFFRFAFSALVLALVVASRGQRLAPRRADIPALLAMGALMTVSSLTLFHSYKHIDVGIASTLLFVYPAMVAIGNALFFKEKPSLFAIVAMCGAVAGVFLLSGAGSGGRLSAVGALLAILSALSYSVYLLALNRSRVGQIPTVKLSFYVLLVGAVVFLCRALVSGGLRAPSTPLAVTCLGGLAIFPTVVALTAMTLSTRYVGSTKTAILGGMEPLTGVAVGLAVFGEAMTLRIGVGMALVIVSITLVLSEGTIRSLWCPKKRHS